MTNKLKNLLNNMCTLQETNTFSRILGRAISEMERDCYFITTRFLMQVWSKSRSINKKKIQDYIRSAVQGVKITIFAYG